jgi:hypothetical protein
MLDGAGSMTLRLHKQCADRFFGRRFFAVVEAAQPRFIKSRLYRDFI